MEEEINIDHLKAINLKKYKVVVMENQGMSISAISKQVDLEKIQVKRILEKFHSFGTVEHDGRKSNVGRPSLIQNEDERNLIQVIQNNEYSPFKQLKTKIREVMEVECSDITIRRKINELGKFQLPQWIPKLTEPQIEKRKLFCKLHLRKRTAFQNIIFTDECRFYLNRNTKKFYVLNGSNIPVKRKSNPDYSILIWGAICYSGKVDIQIIESNINANVYKERLSKFINGGFQVIKDIKNWQFMHDGAPAHRLKYHAKFLENNGLKMHQHPPNSPDFNPIELIWGYLKSEIENIAPETKTDLKSAIEISWEKLTVEIIKNCISHMKKHVKAIHQINGQFTNTLNNSNNN